MITHVERMNLVIKLDFNKYAILSKHQAPNADLKANQQINFTGNLTRDGNTKFFLITKEAKRNYFRFFKRNCESICKNSFCFNIILVQNNSL